MLSVRNTLYIQVHRQDESFTIILQKKTCHANSNFKRVGGAISLSKIEFKTRTVTSDREISQ